MNKKLLGIFVVIILIVAGGAIWYEAQQKEPPEASISVSSEDENKNQYLTQTQIQSEINRIMNDDFIDITNWSTFTNTKYGWSIKYHPNGVWAGGHYEAPEELAAAGYSVYSDSDVYPDIQVSVNRYDDQSISDLDSDFEKGTIGNRIFFARWSSLIFITSNKDNTNVVSIQVNPTSLTKKTQQIVKSLSTFEFLD